LFAVYSRARWSDLMHCSAAGPRRPQCPEVHGGAHSLT
jgi:hypothetical protein